jgi:hypothetical protein
MKYWPLLLLFIFSGCKTSQLNEDIFKEGKSFRNFRGYEPVDPVEFEDKILIKNTDGLLESKPIKLLNREETLGFLNNETVLVAIGEFKQEGSLEYLPIAFSKKNTSYKITMDYMKYATLAQFSDQKFIGSRRVGVGLRLISLIYTAEEGINISDLYSIGLAAKQEKLSGTLIIEVIGIKSKEVTSLIPLPSEINQTTIQNAMQALATIKSKIYDEETSLYPQVMAIKEYRGKEIINDANDQSPVSPLQDLADRSIQLQFGNMDFGSEEREREASRLLQEALLAALNKDVEKSISALKEYGDKFHEYNLNLMLRDLEYHRTSLKDPDAPKWKEIYKTILKEHRDKLPKDIIARLESAL